ncbi:Transferase [Akanthomyces lecanii RCEF 1005]|uniref:Transferase n=1 Tax=Akanthomyces lecanii RCEF 1005 TaxID=1081108 RepID=A0A168HLL4_CORDF|nr:Transferase [Akanthomyces lecanii RCEF 1005]
MDVQVYRVHPSGYPNISQQRFKLSTNDLLNRKPVYVPVCLFFRAPDESKHDTTQLLVAGLERTLRQCRFLAGTIERDKAGDYYILSRQEGTVDFIHNRLDHDETGQLAFASYDSLEANHFLIPNCSDKAHLRVQTLPYGQGSADPGHSPPVIGVQANLIPGGIALAIHFHHWAMDYCALAGFVHQWAGNTYALTCHVPGPELSPACLDRSRLLCKSHIATDAQVTNDEKAPVQAEVAVADSALVDSAVDPTENLSISVCLFHLSKSKAEALKVLVTSEAGLDSCRISSYDAFVALWWRVLTRTRAKFQRLHSLDAVADFTEAVNLRRKLVPPLPDRYLGNAVLFATSATQQHKLTLADVMESASLGTIATYIRSITNSVDAAFIEEQFDQIERDRHQAADVNQAHGAGSPLAFTVNDWRAHNVHDADFGFGRPTGLRHLFGVMPVLVVLPKKRVAGTLEDVFEYLVPVENAAMSGLLQDLDVREWFDFQGVESEP